MNKQNALRELDKIYGVLRGHAYSGKNCYEKLLQMEDDLAAKSRKILELRKLLEAGSYALRSYQYGNASEELAKMLADACDKALEEN